jgi:carbon-monoxide dehydrogenase medium subunit
MEYLVPKTLNETLTLLKKGKDKSKLIAGGTNIIPGMRAKTVRPYVLVDISQLKNLSYIKEEKKRIRIGSLTTISELSSSKIIEKYAPILSQAANQLGNPLVRNRATIAGNLADASPAADTAVPLLALEAMIITERNGGKREIPIDRFFLGPNKTVLKPDEMIKEIIFPKPDPKSKMAYIKLGLRNAMAISVVSIAILMEREREECKKVRIALGAVAPKPIRAYGIEAILTNNKITRELVEACCERVEKEISPISDIRATAEYRSLVSSVLLRRILQQINLELYDR